ncbi:hypothetical protein C8K15_12128 [Paenisporosarcina sp. OV554]|nr:hypothetical protein C8K15_12128 [Paenisporosarcina sp. OV554]
MHFSQLAVSPVYIIVTILCIGYLIFLREDKGCYIFIGRIYSILHIAIYLFALYLYIIGNNL